jgi:hypothetical protein
MEASGVDQFVDALMYGQPTAVMLTLDLFSPAHFPGHSLPQAKLFKLSMPIHRHVPFPR